MRTSGTSSTPRLLAVLAALAAISAATAAITDIRGSVKATVLETRFGLNGDVAEASDTFPESSTLLPLQVVSRLVAVAPEEAAASAAAQFADPRDLNQINPEEFALNLAISCLTPDTRYDARATSEELRSVVFTPGELGPQPAGATVNLIGQLFLDGALAIFAQDANPDLSGASVLLRVTVLREVVGQPRETLFFGAIRLSGDVFGNVQATADGQFPTRTLIATDLAAVVPGLRTFDVLIIPPLTIRYEYTAVVGEPFVLRATVEVEATNQGDRVGVAGLVGTPVDALRDVVSATEDEAAASKIIDAIRSARASPSGVPAFPDRLGQPFNLCGLLFGFELPLIAAGLALARSLPRQGIPHARRRRDRA